VNFESVFLICSCLFICKFAEQVRC